MEEILFKSCIDLIKLRLVLFPFGLKITIGERVPLQLCCCFYGIQESFGLVVDMLHHPYAGDRRSSSLCIPGDFAVSQSEASVDPSGFILNEPVEVCVQPLSVVSIVCPEKTRFFMS